MKPKIKIIQQIQQIDKTVQAEEQTYETQHANLRAQYNITDEQYAGDAPWDEAQYEYIQPASQMLSDHLARKAALNHKKAALVLLAHDIAHCGQPLRVETIKRNLNKLGKYAKFITGELSRPIETLHIDDSGDSLHTELKKHGIVLVDTDLLSNLRTANTQISQKIKLYERAYAHQIKHAPNSQTAFILLQKLRQAKQQKQELVARILKLTTTIRNRQIKQQIKPKVKTR